MTSSISSSAPAMASAASTTPGSQYAIEADVLGMPVKIAPVEELLWQKSFVMERERYDGADVAHILRSCAESLDWDRVLRRFDPYWQLLLSYLVLFSFIYPSERHRIPARSHRRADRRACKQELERAAERGPRLPRHAHVARAVSARHRPVRLRRRAPRAARQHVRRRTPSTGRGRSRTSVEVSSSLQPLLVRSVDSVAALTADTSQTRMQLFIRSCCDRLPWHRLFAAAIHRGACPCASFATNSASLHFPRLPAGREIRRRAP